MSSSIRFSLVSQPIDIPSHGLLLNFAAMTLTVKRVL